MSELQLVAPGYVANGVRVATLVGRFSRLRKSPTEVGTLTPAVFYNDLKSIREAAFAEDFEA